MAKTGHFIITSIDICADHVPTTAAEIFGEVVRQAGNSSRIRGYATNVSNYNPFKAEIPEPYTEYSNSADESNYTTSLSPYLEAEGLPTRFIIDQGRVALPGARAEWVYVTISYLVLSYSLFPELLTCLLLQG